MHYFRDAAHLQSSTIVTTSLCSLIYIRWDNECRILFKSTPGMRNDNVVDAVVVMASRCLIAPAIAVPLSSWLFKLYVLLTQGVCPVAVLPLLLVSVNLYMPTIYL